MNELLQESDFGPARFGPYHRVRELGTGAMGAVLEVQDERTGARYALKVILPDALDADTLARFQREAHAMAQLNHPHVARIRSAQLEPPLRYLVLDLYPGGTLRERMQRGPLPWAQAADLVGKLADGVAHAHAKRILHRDIKPTNVLFDADGEPVLTDFGLARAGDASRMTRTGELLGTPLYMAPEQVIDGKRTGPAADVYALGALLYLTLTGRPPIEAGFSLMETLDKVVTQVPPPPSELVPGLPAEVDALCRRALAKEPDDRPSAAELARGLRGLGPSPSEAPRTSWAPLLVPLICAVVVGLSVTLAARVLGSGAAGPLPPADPPKPRAEEEPQLPESAPPRSAPAWVQRLDGRSMSLTLCRRDVALTLLAHSAIDYDPSGAWTWTWIPRAVRTYDGRAPARYLRPRPESPDLQVRLCARLCGGPTVLRFDSRNRVVGTAGPGIVASAEQAPLLTLAGSFAGEPLRRLLRDLLALPVDARSDTPRLNLVVIGPGAFEGAVLGRPDDWAALLPVELAEVAEPPPDSKVCQLADPGGSDVGARAVFEGLLIACNGVDDADFYLDRGEKETYADPTRSLCGWLELPLTGADARLRGLRPPHTLVAARAGALAFSRPWGAVLGEPILHAPHLKLGQAVAGWTPIAWQAGEAWVPEDGLQDYRGEAWIGVVTASSEDALNVRRTPGDDPLARPRLGSVRSGQVLALTQVGGTQARDYEDAAGASYVRIMGLDSFARVTWGRELAFVRSVRPTGYRDLSEVYLFLLSPGVQNVSPFANGSPPAKPPHLSSARGLQPQR
ncbi:MAG: serine/threonine-protein kinase [Planctomycetota bacterium]